MNPMMSLIGKFVTSFGVAEAYLNMLLQGLTGMSEVSARIICSGMRNTDIIKATKDLITVSEMTEAQKNKFQNILTQLSKISIMRNNLVHRHIFVSSETKVIASNTFTSKRYDPNDVSKIIAEEVPYDIPTIEAACNDLLFIVNYILFWKFAPANLDTNYYQSYTWQYNPPESANRDR